MDSTPRKINREEDCHAASISFIEFSGLAPVSIDLFESIMSYEDLRDAVEEHPLPILIKIQASDPKVENGRMIAAHSCIIVGKTNTDFICFEKVGVAYPWRLAPLTEIHQMYEHDFVTANEHRPQMQWEITALARRGGHAER